MIIDIISMINLYIYGIFISSAVAVSYHIICM